ncbi:hypothetical protein PT974_07244 [Cladobotryum mycophilum]|uniref:Uncharacterized protein n=1 Tax=Cladobotryum mycophilum TaxID=491253 RepID=A0ABR0SNS8_9HYPO
MSSNSSKSSPQVKSTPRSLIPVLSTSLNVGMALGGYIMTIPFENREYPGPAIALWFNDFFTPGFIGVTTLGVLTLTSGFRAFRIRKDVGSSQDQANAKAASRWALAGLAFTVIHFGFGNTVLAIMDRILANPELAQPEMASWTSMHIVRTLTTDVPAWLCFVKALLSEI